MTGSVAANFHEGSRSETIADYLLSSWGTVTPVRRQDDHGLDLYCTLTERIGQRALVTDYYSVQVKSTLDPLVLSTAESVRWIVENPNPLFLAVVNKSKGELLLYQTLTRFLIAIQQVPSSLKLTPADATEGHCPSGLDDLENMSLSVPILRFSLADSLDDDKMGLYQEILRDWIRIDRHNCNLRATGVLRLRMPHEYRTNERPTSRWAELGNLRPDDHQLARAVQALVECLDCVGHQLSVRTDRRSALYASMLLRHLRNRYASAFPLGSRWEPGSSTSLESEVRAEFNAGFQPYDSEWREVGDVLDAGLADIPRVVEFLRGG